MNALESVSTRPYLIRALYDWCTDNGFTPYVAVQVDETVQVPREYVKDGEIVLNISFDATSSLKIGNQMIEFKARFAGTAREIMVPIERVIAIYARENGQGMAFPLSGPAAETGQAHRPVPVTAAPQAAATDNRVVQLVSATAEGKDAAAAKADDGEPPRPPAGGGPRPSLKRVK